MKPWRDLIGFAVTLAALVVGFFHESLIGGKVLSSADVLLISASFRGVAPPDYEPVNRLLMDPTLQFEPWIEFNRAMIRSGRLPLWNSASGCGAPHLANGQSAVFDPFQIIAYLGTVPAAFAWMAAARLWFAGVGMFLLARVWGLGAWGCWFAGLVYPLSGFVVVWLLYPVTNVAIWMPWVLLMTQAVWDRPNTRQAIGLALTVGGTLLGGHVQTAAHVLLAAGAYASFLTFRGRYAGRSAFVWVAGVTLGIMLAAIEVVPLGAYLTRSPVWGDRNDERVAPWKLVRPRIFEMACVAFPSIYGSQRRGEPNLARVVGADNQNESAGGYAGLVTLIWLAPLAWSARRGNPRVGFLVGLTLFAFAAAYRLPPVDNLLRALPVLKVTDNRRLTLWVAFGLTMLGGLGLDQLGSFRSLMGRGWRVWGIVWAVGSVGMLGASATVQHFGPAIRDRAEAHYARAAALTPGADRLEYQARATRQTEATLHFVPRYLIFKAAEGLILAALLAGYRSGRLGARPTRAALLVLTLGELGRFGYGLNPAIDLALNRPMTPLIAEFQRRVGLDGRIIGLGAEFPPNVLMRYGLRDTRNYDSVETRRNLDWFRPIYDPNVAAQTSRREVSWDRVAQARERLRVAGVRAVVGATPPPPGLGSSERWGNVWVAWLEADPLVSLAGYGRILDSEGGDGRFVVRCETDQATTLMIRETFDPGWRGWVDGRPVTIEADRQAFLGVEIPAGKHRVILIYDPVEVRAAGWISVFASLILVFGLTGSLLFRSTRSVVPRSGWTQTFGLESDS